MMVNITGMVKQDNKCEIIAMPAATVVSFPYALGITIVFKPSGMATELIAQIVKVSEVLRKYNSSIITIGKSIKRITVTAYMLMLVKMVSVPLV